MSSLIIFECIIHSQIFNNKSKISQKGTVIKLLIIGEVCLKNLAHSFAIYTLFIDVLIIQRWEKILKISRLLKLISLHTFSWTYSRVSLEFITHIITKNKLRDQTIIFKSFVFLKHTTIKSKTLDESIYITF